MYLGPWLKPWPIFPVLPFCRCCIRFHVVCFLLPLPQIAEVLTNSSFICVVYILKLQYFNCGAHLRLLLKKATYVLPNLGPEDVGVSVIYVKKRSISVLYSIRNSPRHRGNPSLIWLHYTFSQMGWLVAESLKQFLTSWLSKSKHTSGLQQSRCTIVPVLQTKLSRHKAI